MVSRESRADTWTQLHEPWDVVVVGGGITGAGILAEAAKHGLRSLLLEQRDFAWGTSSRSSKLVHGGLRYLKQGRIGLTRASVREREQLLREVPGLVEPIGFLWATYEGSHPGRWLFEAGLSLYDLLALRWSHRYYEQADFQMLVPRLSSEGLSGGFQYSDAQTDDARLVLRVIHEAVRDGAVALNYARVTSLAWQDGDIKGVRVQDELSQKKAEVACSNVINATGAWADALRADTGAAPELRLLRGSHIVFPHWRLPVAQAVSFAHPYDGRPVFVLPWEGTTLVGTTDVDHEEDLSKEPCISGDEIAYLMAAVDAHFPSYEIRLGDIMTSFAGVRAVVDTGAADPSEESRDHVIWRDGNLLTVTGGKLTTFRTTARDALSHLEKAFPQLARPHRDSPLFSSQTGELDRGGQLDETSQARLWGRYGPEAASLVAAAHEGELEEVPGTRFLWAELRWAARHEAVVHLDDLLLRRVRLGLILPRGGATHVERFREICQAELGWNHSRWEQEWEDYCHLIERCYLIPPDSPVADWPARVEQDKQPSTSDRERVWLLYGPLIALIAALVSWLWLRNRD